MIFLLVNLLLKFAKPILLIAAIVAAAIYADIGVVSFVNGLITDYAARQLLPF